jgi:hypothetical protein
MDFGAGIIAQQVRAGLDEIAEKIEQGASSIASMSDEIVEVLEQRLPKVKEKEDVSE